jgi:hypothetical protein
VTLDGRQLTWRHGAPAWKGRLTSHRVRAHDGRVTLGVAPMSATWALLDRAAP